MAAETTYLERYLTGEHEQVWAELVAMGERVRAEPIYSDAWAVACETMRRVRLNIERLIPRLVRMGFVFGYDGLIHETLRRPMQGADWTDYLAVQAWSRQQPPLFQPAQFATEYRDHIISMGLGDVAVDLDIFTPSVAATDMRAHIDELDAIAGPLPLSLRAWYTEVGAVNFYGSYPGWTRFMKMPKEVSAYRDRYLMSECDPLQVCVLDAARMRDLRNLHAQGRLHQFEFAEDPYFKVYTGGSSTPFAFAVPKPTMDDTLEGYEPKLTFVEYLRLCLRWAGFPGMAQWKDPPVGELAFVTEDLIPF